MIDAKSANEFFHYDEKTGALTRKVSRGRRWGIGRLVGSINSEGYRCLEVNGVVYKAHRVIWLMKTGAWPVNQIDPINRDRTDNRWSNLREATKEENRRNREVRSEIGVYFWRSRNRWRVQVQGRHVGYFKTKEEAIAARAKAATLAYGEAG